MAETQTTAVTSLMEHEESDDCPVCRTQSLADLVLVPAVQGWEDANQLQRHSLHLHGAATLLGMMLQEGHNREAVEKGIADLLDEFEMHIAETRALGGPTQGTA